MFWDGSDTKTESIRRDELTQSYGGLVILSLGNVRILQHFFDINSALWFHQNSFLDPSPHLQRYLNEYTPIPAREALYHHWQAVGVLIRISPSPEELKRYLKNERLLSNFEGLVKEILRLIRKNSHRPAQSYELLEFYKSCLSNV